MNNRLYTVLILIASALMLVAAVIALRSGGRLQPSGGEADPREGISIDTAVPDDKLEETSARAADARSVKSRSKSGKTLEERNKAKFDVGEMRREAEDMLQRFRGTPEERQDVIKECEAGKALLLAITDAELAEFDDKSPEELEEAREDFEKEYRAQLDYLQSGKLKRMLKTPEEQAVIGSTLDAAQDFLERLDEALHSAGY